LFGKFSNVDVNWFDSSRKTPLDYIEDKIKSIKSTIKSKENHKEDIKMEFLKNLLDCFFILI
jgi:hypothetical protein